MCLRTIGARRVTLGGPRILLVVVIFLILLICMRRCLLRICRGTGLSVLVLMGLDLTLVRCRCGRMGILLSTICLRTCRALIRRLVIRNLLRSSGIRGCRDGGLVDLVRCLVSGMIGLVIWRVDLGLLIFNWGCLVALVRRRRLCDRVAYLIRLLWSLGADVRF